MNFHPKYGKAMPQSTVVSNFIDVQRLIDAAEPYHIDNIVPLYERILI